jgi:type II secretory pathway pseudopilin PulG
MRNRRSFTILELLIVIGLLAGLAAIVVPLVSSSLSERAFETAADSTGEQLMLARAHAQATGSPVEVSYNSAKAQVQARSMSAWLHPFQILPPVSKSAPNVIEGDCPPTPADDESPDHQLISESWACRDLGKTVRITNHRPLQNDSSIGQSQTTSMDYSELTRGSDDVRLAVFMPDGSALMGSPVWFNDDDGRLGKLTINPWSGLPVFERVPPELLVDQKKSESQVDRTDPDLTQRYNTAPGAELDKSHTTKPPSRKIPKTKAQ